MRAIEENSTATLRLVLEMRCHQTGERAGRMFSLAVGDAVLRLAEVPDATAKRREASEGRRSATYRSALGPFSAGVR